ncbi:hypothetical protein [Citrobacter amalonaticus]|uniref:hypothetical protein n=1 Tax=Citrobacter amalonaticus TaxID=35703 RepID=UPI001C5307A1|nr:hypothetical protein [Citrobacter amalonaticus]MBW0869540.1 hypothetical protein [Citrobacter amalonaticus]
MSNIDKQAVQAVADLKAGYTLGHADVAILNELARIALASLEAEPAIHRWRRVTVEPYGPYPWHYGDFIGFSNPVEGIEDEYFYSAPPAPVSVPDYPETLPCPVMLEPGLRFGKGVPTRTMLGALQRRAECYAEFEAMTPEQRAEHEAGMKEFAAMLQGAEPVTTAYKLPPHVYRELVNSLRDTAVKYHGCQQLREQLSRTLQEVIEPAAPRQEDL